MITVNEMWEVV